MAEPAIFRRLSRACQTNSPATRPRDSSSSPARRASRLARGRDPGSRLRRARDRQRKLISKIDAALRRIEEGTYGFCEETGDPITLRRLEARPIATLSLEAQERHERRERVYRDN